MSDTDLELLARYTRQHAEDAFAELVRRRLGLVYSAALRQVRSPQLAEEVAQSAFTDLARSAPRLKPDTVLTAWLYQVTRRTAIDVVRREASRQLREQISTEMKAMNATAADWTHIEPLLDEAMHALDDTDRTAVLLRYFENKSLREVGATLGTSENAAQKRLARAVERLREFFAKRGVTVGASGLVVVISANAVQAAPVGLAVTISTAATLGGNTLITTATIIMASTKTKFCIVVGLILVGVTTAVLWQHRPDSSFQSFTADGHPSAVSSTGVSSGSHRDRSTPLRSMHSLLASFGESDVDGALASLLFEKPEEEPIKAVLADEAAAEARFQRVIAKKFGPEAVATVRRRLPMAGGPGVETLAGAEEVLDGNTAFVRAVNQPMPYPLTKVGGEWKVPISYYVQKAGTPERFVEIHRSLIARLEEVIPLIEAGRFQSASEAAQTLSPRGPARSKP